MRMSSQFPPVLSWTRCAASVLSKADLLFRPAPANSFWSYWDKRGYERLLRQPRGLEGPHGQGDPMGRATPWAGRPPGPWEPMSLDRWNLLTPSSWPCSWFPASSAAAICWLAMSLLTQGAETPPKTDGASSSQCQHSHGLWQRVPLRPWDAGCRGQPVRGSCK